MAVRARPVERAQAPAAPAVQRPRQAFGPWYLLAAVAAAAMTLAATTPFVDPDLSWHLEVGRQILGQRSLSDLGASWSFARPDADWATTQWLSEVVLHLVDRVAGMRGIQVLRLLVAFVVALLLARLLLRRSSTVWGPLVFALAAASVAPSLQERPQLFSWPLLVLLAGFVHREIAGGGTRPWALVALTFVWANLHGTWILVPSVLLLLAAAGMLDGRHWKPRVHDRRLLVAAAASTGAAALTPAGPELLWSAARFAQSTSHITEWQRTAPVDPSALLLDVVAVLFVLAWVRSRRAVALSELLYVGALVGFGLLAFRNTGTAVVLLAPVLLHRLQTTFPRESRAAGRERRVLVALCATVLLLAGTAAVARVAVAPVVGATLPVALAQQLAADGAAHRVLNDYDTGGTVIHDGGDSLVAVDGRADYYGSAYLEDYFDLLRLRPGWEQRLQELAPDRALLRIDAPMTDQLRRNGWSEIGSDGTYVLLAPAGQR